MLTWLLYLPVALLVTVLCYITNPIVALFADEEGELPGFLHLWQTWDDSLDSEYYMHNVVPSWLDYGYDEHYTVCSGSDLYIQPYGRTRQFSVIRPGAKWTIKQRLQRYLCRVLWIYRNAAYGWMFFVLGSDMSNTEYKISDPDKSFGSFGSGLKQRFVYKNDKTICSWLRWKIYLGWKTSKGNTEPKRCMYAYRVWLKFLF